MFKVYTSSCLK